MRFSKRIASATILAGLFLLAGCGFHLRGDEPLPASLGTVAVVGDAFDPLVQGLRRQLEAAGARVVDDGSGSALRLLNSRFERRTLSVGADGRVRERELTLSARFDLRSAAGGTLIESQELQVVREQLYDETQVVGRAEEETFVRREMERDLVAAILRRIRAQGG
ncbi:MAG: hypothetical protein KDG50_14700 [Chromatiales bacterium]|nr:hypothetical protein [Chromatiales bacterium]